MSPHFNFFDKLGAHPLDLVKYLLTGWLPFPSGLPSPGKLPFLGGLTGGLTDELGGLMDELGDTTDWFGGLIDGLTFPGDTTD